MLPVALVVVTALSVVFGLITWRTNVPFRRTAWLGAFFLYAAVAHHQPYLYLVSVYSSVGPWAFNRMFHWLGIKAQQMHRNREDQP